MNGKDILQQYTDLKVEIKDIEKKIKKLKNQVDTIEHDSVTGSDSYFPYTKRPFHIKGINVKKQKRLEKLKKLLTERMDACEDMKIRIEEFIHEIPKSLTRRVFQYRYIDDLTWQAIATRIGRHDESYPRKIIHDKYLENL